jgi:hypothetical protein
MKTVPTSGERGLLGQDRESRKAKVPKIGRELGKGSPPSECLRKV